MHEDPDFAEDYMSGVYDRDCETCSGRGRVQVFDEERCSPDQLALIKWKRELDAELARDRYSERFCDPDYLAELRGY